MLQRGWIGGLVLAGLLVGCAPKAPPSSQPASMPAPVPTYTLDSARAQIQSGNPNTTAVVGTVVAVLPEANFAAVSDMPVKDFNTGDSIAFLDDSLSKVAMGVVENIVNGRLQVRYDAPTAGGRIPQVGDFAVHIFTAMPSSAPTAPTASGSSATPSPAESVPGTATVGVPTGSPATPAPADSGTSAPAPSAPGTPTPSPSTPDTGGKGPDLNK